MRASDILLENKKQYTQMMQPLVDVGALSQEQANKTIADARKALKRNDRIVWVLKWQRLSIVSMAISSLKTDNTGSLETPDQLGKKGAVLQKMATKYGLYEAGVNVLNIQRPWPINGHYIPHLMSMIERIPQMDAVVWEGTPNGLKDKMNGIEATWQESREQFVNPQDRNDKVIIDMDNGQGWVLLDRSYCDAEGSAMGHCGNDQGDATDTDTILSFRTILSDTEQKPHLTFIISKDGILGEMKGRANQKPNQKYHPAIVKLLLHPMVKGIDGGGYDPANNFAMADMAEDQQNMVFDAKPSLMTTTAMFKKIGVSKELIQKIKGQLQAKALPPIAKITDKYVVLERWTSFSDFINVSPGFAQLAEYIFHSDSVKDMVKMIEPLEFDQELMLKIMESIPSSLRTKIYREYGIDENYPFNYTDGDQEFYEFFDKHKEDLAKVLLPNVTRFTEQEVMDAIIPPLKSKLRITDFESDDRIEFKYGASFSDPVFMLMPIMTFCYLIDFDGDNYDTFNVNTDEDHSWMMQTESLYTVSDIEDEFYHDNQALRSMIHQINQAPFSEIVEGDATKLFYGDIDDGHIIISSSDLDIFMKKMNASLSSERYVKKQ